MTEGEAEICRSRWGCRVSGNGITMKGNHGRISGQVGAHLGGPGDRVEWAGVWGNGNMACTLSFSNWSKRLCTNLELL